MGASHTTISPYITFDGNCREAMEFYQQALEGHLVLTPYEGSPVEVPGEHSQKVLHASLRFGDSVLLGADAYPIQKKHEGHNVAISIAENDPEKAESIFKKLSTEGTILQPFDDTFWGAKFAMWIDKFDIKWMINCGDHG